MRVLVTGSTTWDDAAALRRELSALPAHMHMVELAKAAGVEARTFLR
jgi:hypothetical protein